jgi:hypothetical protein
MKKEVRERVRVKRGFRNGYGKQSGKIYAKEGDIN